MTQPSQEIRISADSHLSEPPDLWEKNLPIKFRERAPRFPRIELGKALHSRPGGWDPGERLKDMAMDGVSAELLFPTVAKGIYDQASDDPDLAAACDRTYNDWLIEYCQEAPERLWGQAFIGLWNIDYAVSELQRTRNAGLKAATIWVIPPDELPFTSDHYERFWSAAEDLDMPITMHINTGFGLYAEGSEARPEGGVGNPIASAARRAFGHKAAVAQSLTEMMLSGVFERHPRLKVIIAEFGVGWIPYWLEDLDRKSAGQARGLPLKPSEYFNRQVYATFEQDGVGGYLLQRWGADNFLWSNDYPHGGGIWPYSDDIIALTLNEVSPDVRRKVLGENVARVFGLPMPAAMPRLPLPENAEKIWNRPWLKRVGEYTFDKPVMGL